MVEPTLDQSLDRLRGALTMMDEDHRGFESTRAEAAAFYSERTHALPPAMHVQSLNSQIEDRVFNDAEACAGQASFSF